MICPRSIDAMRSNDLLSASARVDPPPRILLLYGSLRERSFSRLCVEEAARLLQFFGCETRIFDPSTLPLPDQHVGDDHPAVHELRELSLWSEGQVWCSPERHGQITGIMKLQIDHLPLSMGGMRPTQGRTLAVMQVSAGSQSFNSVNTLRVLGRWMRMVTIPNVNRRGILTLDRRPTLPPRFAFCVGVKTSGGMGCDGSGLRPPPSHPMPLALGG